MRHLKKIASNLKHGDIDSAVRERESLGIIRDKSLKLEIEEITKQAVLQHLKAGEIGTARKIQELFSMPDDLFDDTVSQAVLSSFRDGDIDRVKALKKELPIPERIGADLVAYCSTWGDAAACALMQEVLA